MNIMSIPAISNADSRNHFVNSIARPASISRNGIVNAKRPIANPGSIL